MSINVIAESITLERCKELLFLYALSGSDYTSRFFHIKKVKLLNSWLVNQDVLETFIHLGDCHFCYDDSNCFSIDLARYEIFKYSKNIEIQFYCRQKML